MANANQILPFGLADGANVMPPQQWQGDTTRLSGFVQGTASSERANTALRQASFSSAMIAQFTADYGPGDVLDDGNLAEYESEFVSALGKVIQSLIPGLLYEGTDTGSANHVVVGEVYPTLTVLTAGKMLLVTKNLANTDATDANILGVTGSVVWGDGSQLSGGDWPANESALLYYNGAHFQILSFPGPSFFRAWNNGEGIAVDSNARTISLNFSGLTEEDTLADSDLFAFFQTVTEGGQAANHHRTISKAALKTALLGIGAGVIQNIQLITASGTYTKTAGTTKAIVFATGGGGAGGSSDGESACCGTGGSPGGTGIALVDLSAVSTVACTIGAGGAPAAANAGCQVRAGAGGATSFGAYAVGPGGPGGYSSVAAGPGTELSTGGTGLVILRGSPGSGVVGNSWGGGWSALAIRGGDGGSSIYGGAGRGMDANISGQTGATPVAGEAATGYGSGGGGGDSGTVTAMQGGAGAGGAILVLEVE